MATITAVETIEDSEYPLLVWVRVHTDDGRIGLGETFHGAGAVASIIHQTLSKLLIGQDPSRIELLWRHMFKTVHYAGHAGTEMRAISAIDMALWDLLGQAAGLPVYVLLGGAARERIPTYNTCAGDEPLNDFQRSTTDPGGLAKDLLASGIRAMKIWPFDDLAAESLGQRITSAQLKRGVAPLAAVRDAVADDMDVAIEGHCLWNLPSAIRIAKAVEPFRPMWIEELMPPDNPSATRTLREATAIPIVTSERLITRFAFRSVIEERAADIVMLDLDWTGGFTEARKIAALADTHQLPVAPHNPGGPLSHLAAAHFCAATCNLFIMESVRAFYLGWFAECLTYTLVPRDGQFPLPPGPGLGAELRPEFLARPSVSRQISTAAPGELSGYAVGNPYRGGNPWKRPGV